MINWALGILLTGLAIFGTYEYARAAHWEGEYDKLGYSYAQASLAATTHAAAVSEKQDAAIKTQTDNALSQASAATSKANASKAVYDAKLAAIAKQNPKDLPHICANVLIPADLK